MKSLCLRGAMLTLRQHAFRWAIFLAFLAFCFFGCGEDIEGNEDEAAIEMLVGTWEVILIDNQSPDEILRQSGLGEMEKDLPVGGSVDYSWSTQFLFFRNKDVRTIHIDTQEHRQFRSQILLNITMDFGDPLIPTLKMNIKQTGNGDYTVSGNIIDTTILLTDTTIDISPQDFEDLIKPEMALLTDELSKELLGGDTYWHTVQGNYLTLKQSDGTEILLKRK